MTTSIICMNEGTGEYMKRFEVSCVSPTGKENKGSRRKFANDLTNTAQCNDEPSKRTRGTGSSCIVLNEGTSKYMERFDQSVKMSKADQAHRAKHRKAGQQVCRSAHCKNIVGRKGQHSSLRCARWCKECRVVAAKSHKVNLGTPYGEAPQVLNAL